ncbi:hypothetical protein AHAS_Ahas20G0027600 [Arachis hypogaea]
MDTPLYLQRVSCVHCPLSVHNGSIPPSQVSTLTTHHPFLSLSLSTLLSECLSEIWVGLSFSFPREVHVNLAERSGHLNNPKGLLSLSFRCLKFELPSWLLCCTSTKFTLLAFSTFCVSCVFVELSLLNGIIGCKTWCFSPFW